MPRKLGGQRRKREGALEVAYDLEGLDSVLGLRRVLELALFDTVNLENSLGRGRLLVAVAQAGGQLLVDRGAREAMMRPSRRLSHRTANSWREVDRLLSLAEEWAAAIP